MDGYLVAAAGTIIAGVVWAVRQEGRITSIVELFEAHEDRDTERFEETRKLLITREKLDDERHSDNKARLTRIEDKLDKLPQRGRVSDSAQSAAWNGVE
jgi:hypothetical protein